MSYAAPSAALGRHRLERSTVTGPAAAAPVESLVTGRRPLGRRLGGLAMNGLVALGVLVFLLLAVGPHIFGYRTATMLTGSMEPGIMPGDVVVTVPKPAVDVQVGDVITYAIPVEDHRVETHRVTKVIRHTDGTIAIRTKGDNNEGVDPWTATLEGDTVWEARAVVPKLGTAIRTLRSPAIQHGVLWVAFGGLLLLGLRLIWGSSDEDGHTENDPTGNDPTGNDRPEEQVAA